MRYYVATPAGEKFGPADLALLTSWVADQRLFPHSMLEEEGSGNRVQASQVPGLTFATAVAAPMAPMAPPPPGAGYAPSAPQQPFVPPAPGEGYLRPGYSPSAVSADSGAKEMWLAFGMAVAAPLVGLLLIYGMFIAVAGVGSAWRAYKKGQKWAMLALVLNVIAIPIAFYMRFILRYQLTHNNY